MRVAQLLVAVVTSAVALSFFSATLWQLVAVLIAVTLGVGFFFAGLQSVEEGHAVVIERFGRFARTSGPGLVWIIPWIERVARTVDIRLRPEPVVVDNVFTRDNVPLIISLMIAYRVDLGPHARLRSEAAYYSAQQRRELLQAHVESALTNLSGDYSVLQLIGSERWGWSEIQDRLGSMLNASLRDWALSLDDSQAVIVRSFRLPTELRAALERATTAGISTRTSMSALEAILQRYPEIPQVVLVQLLQSLGGTVSPGTWVVPTSSSPMQHHPTVRGTDSDGSDRSIERKYVEQLPDIVADIGTNIVRRTTTPQDEPDDR